MAESKLETQQKLVYEYGTYLQEQVKENWICTGMRVHFS